MVTRTLGSCQMDAPVMGTLDHQLPSATNTCPEPQLDLLRKQWIPATPYAIDWFRRMTG